MVRVEGSVGEDGVDAEGQMSVTGGKRAKVPYVAAVPADHRRSANLN